MSISRFSCYISIFNGEQSSNEPDAPNTRTVTQWNWTIYRLWPNFLWALFTSSRFQYFRPSPGIFWSGAGMVICSNERGKWGGKKYGEEIAKRETKKASDRWSCRGMGKLMRSSLWRKWICTLFFPLQMPLRVCWTDTASTKMGKYYSSSNLFWLRSDGTTILFIDAFRQKNIFWITFLRKIISISFWLLLYKLISHHSLWAITEKYAGINHNYE